MLDPMLRIIAPTGWDQELSAAVERLRADLPEIDDSAGMPMSAPALMVPRILDLGL